MDINLFNNLFIKYVFLLKYVIYLHKYYIYSVL